MQLSRAIRYCERVKILAVEMPPRHRWLPETDSFRLSGQMRVSEDRQKSRPRICYAKFITIDCCNRNVAVKVSITDTTE